MLLLESSFPSFSSLDSISWVRRVTLPSVGEDVEKSFLAVSHEVKHTLTLCPSNSTPWCLPQRNENIHPHKDLYPNVYNSFTHNSPQMETTSNCQGPVRRQKPHQCEIKFLFYGKTRKI